MISEKGMAAASENGLEVLKSAGEKKNHSESAHEDAPYEHLALRRVQRAVPSRYIERT